MSKHKDNLDDCRTWRELEDYAEHHGLPYDRSCGGHNIHKNERGSMPFSGHEKEPSKGLLHQVKKQMLKLMIVYLFLFCILPTMCYVKSLFI